MIDTIKLRVHGANQHKKGIVHKMIADNTNNSLHLCPEHNALFMKLHNIKKDGFTITKILSQEKIINNNNHINDVVTKESSSQINEHYYSTNKIRYQSAEYVKERTLKAWGTYSVRSSESNVTYALNPEGGFIDFEFSIPKYLFGHNLAQFIPQSESPTYFKNISNITSWSKQKRILFKRFSDFVYLFFQDLFFNLELEYEPNMNYIELTRLDLCYNQYFNSKEESLAYLNEQKKLKKNSKIYSPDTNVDFQTTLAWRTQHGNYFKIYHKGTEYINQKHGDFKKHSEINRDFLDYYFKYKNNKNPTWEQAFDLPTTDKTTKKKEQISYNKSRRKIHKILKSLVNSENFYISQNELNQFKKELDLSEKLQPINAYYLKSEMDKILRYEVSISGKYASYQFKNYIFRKDDRIHQEAKRVYKQVKRQLNNVDRFDKKIEPHLMTLYKMYHKWFSKSNHLVLSKNPLLKRHSKKVGYDFDKETNSYNISDAYKEFGLSSLLDKSSVSPFTETYLIHLVDNFKKLIDNFQVMQLEPFDNLEKRVNRFNEIAEQNYLRYNQTSINKVLLSQSKKRKYLNLLKKKNPDYIKRSDLLTEKEKQEKGIQKMSYSNMIQFFTLMHDEKLSQHQIQEKLNLSKGQYYRRKKNLKLLGISETHVNMKIPVNPKIDFFSYYSRTTTLKHKKNFYLNPIHAKYF